MSNVAVGYYSLVASTTGACNIAVGVQAGDSVTTGVENVFVGSFAGANVTTGDNNLLLGDNAGKDSVRNVTTGDHSIVIGNNSHATAHIKIDWTVTSDERDKMNFEPVPHGLDFVNQLKPVSFVFKKSRDDATPHGPQKYGFKAQDILALEGDNPIIISNEDEENLKVTNSHMTPVLVKAIQELTKRIEELEKENN